MSAPWGIELNQHILGVVQDNVLVSMGHHNNDRASLFFGNRLRLDAGLHLASNKFLDKGPDRLLCQRVSLKGVLLVLDRLLNGKGGPLVGEQVKIASMSTKSLCVDGCKVDGALEFLSNGPEGLGERLALFLGLSEDVSERNTRLANSQLEHAVTRNTALTPMYPA